MKNSALHICYEFLISGGILVIVLTFFFLQITKRRRSLKAWADNMGFSYGKQCKGSAEEIEIKRISKSIGFIRSFQTSIMRGVFRGFNVFLFDSWNLGGGGTLRMTVCQIQGLEKSFPDFTLHPAFMFWAPISKECKYTFSCDVGFSAEDVLDSSLIRYLEKTKDGSCMDKTTR